MKNYTFFPVALARFLDRPVIASRLGFSTQKQDIAEDKLSVLAKIRNENRGKTFPGMDEYFDNADGKITMPVKVECPVHDLLISRGVTPREDTCVPSILLSTDFPSERYVVYRPEIKASELPLSLPAALPAISSIPGYHGKDEDILKTGHLLTYPGIDDY